MKGLGPIILAPMFADVNDPVEDCSCMYCLDMNILDHIYYCHSWHEICRIIRCDPAQDLLTGCLQLPYNFRTGLCTAKQLSFPR